MNNGVLTGVDRTAQSARLAAQSAPWFIFRAAVDQGATAIVSLHDVNLAARFADRCLLLFGDGRWQLGPTDDILSEETLEKLYGVAMEMLPWKGRNVFMPAIR